MSVAALAAAMLGCAAFTNSPAARWPPLPSPPHAEITRLAAETSVNDQSMLIGEYSIAMPISQVINFYRRHVHVAWREIPADQATLLGAAWQGFFVTIELRAVGDLQTMVRTSLAAPLHRRRANESDWPLPPDSQILSRLNSRDGCRTAEVLLLRNRRTATANSDYLVQALHSAGYRIETRSPVGGRGVRGELLRLTAPGKRSEVALTDSDGWCWIRVITTVDSP